MSLKVPLGCLVVLLGKSYSAQTIVTVLSRLRLKFYEVHLVVYEPLSLNLDPSFSLEVGLKESGGGYS